MLILAIVFVLYVSDVGEQDDEYETWYDAGAFCNRKGGHLVSVHNEDEQRFIMGQVGCTIL